MGLDNYWVNKDGEETPVEGEFQVCGGLLAGHGNSSFRGKVYSELVAAITGTSLYTEHILPAEVKRMSEIINGYSHRQINCRARKEQLREVSESEWTGFQSMWKAHAEAGHGLLALW